MTEHKTESSDTTPKMNASAPVVPSASKTIKIKFLKNCGHFTEGQEVDVPPEVAEQYCAVRERDNGHGLVKWQNACLVSDLEKLKNLDPVHGGLSLDECRALGIKNVAVDPNGPGPIEPERLRGKKSAKVEPETTSDDASFSEVKSPDEGKSAKQSLELNANNPANKKKAQT